jgi:hypothetical protein
MKILVKTPSSHSEYESLAVYCQKISKKNNSLLYHLEKYLGKKLLSDNELTEIRDLILTVSGDISRLPDISVVIDGDENERL